MQGDDGVFMRTGGDGGPVLLLLHGLGGTVEVWDGLVALLDEHWPGAWLAADLPGHGRSRRLGRYTFGGLAATLAPALPAGVPLAIIGHSLGGAVALALGSGWFGVRPLAVAGLGIKVRWSDEELANAAEMAARPTREFADRDEAAGRALKVAGLAGLVPAASAFVDAAISGTEGAFRLAVDPACFAIGAPDMGSLLAACRGTVVLAAGEHDPMCPAAHLRALVPDPAVLAGLGHNAHVERPEALLPIIGRLAALLS